MSKINFASKFLATAVTAVLLTGAGAGGAVAEGQTSTKSRDLAGLTVTIGHGQNSERFDLFENYDADIDRKTVLFGSNTNEVKFDGLGTLTNHFDANGNYEWSRFTDDPSVDASGDQSRTEAFGVTHTFVHQPKGASSSRVYALLTLQFKDMATHTSPVTDTPAVTTPNINPADMPSNGVAPPAPMADTSPKASSGQKGAVIGSTNTHIAKTPANRKTDAPNVVMTATSITDGSPVVFDEDVSVTHAKSLTQSEVVISTAIQIIDSQAV